MKILVVDDDHFVLEVISRLLGDQDFELIKRSSAEDAIALFEDGASFDLVITDIIMPEKDGTDLAMYVKSHSPKTPILAITGGLENALDDFVHLAEMFTDETMCKPLHKDALLSSIKRLTVH